MAATADALTAAEKIYGDEACCRKIATSCETAMKTPVRRNGFRERSRPDVHILRRHAEVLVSASTSCAEHAGCVRLIHHEEAAELLLERNQVRQAADVAVHGKHAITDDQGAIGRAWLLQLVACRLRVVVPKPLNLNPRHAARVEQATVAQFIDDHPVRRPERP